MVLVIFLYPNKGINKKMFCFQTQTTFARMSCRRRPRTTTSSSSRRRRWRKRRRRRCCCSGRLKPRSGDERRRRPTRLWPQQPSRFVSCSILVRQDGSDGVFKSNVVELSWNYHFIANNSIPTKMAIL